MRKGAVLSLVLVLCLLLSGCSKTFSASYLHEDGEEVIEFFKDGTIEVTNKSFITSGTYEYIEKDIYEIRMNVLWGQRKYKAVFDDDMLELTLESTGEVFIYYLIK